MTKKKKTITADPFLKEPCPFCGSREVGIAYDPDARLDCAYYGKCHSCGFTTKNAIREEEVAKIWSDRYSEGQGLTKSLASRLQEACKILMECQDEINSLRKMKGTPWIRWKWGMESKDPA